VNNPRKYRRRFGDRPDGRRLRTIDPLFSVAAHIMKKKSGAANYFSATLNIVEAERWLREKRRDNMPGLGLLHFFIAAFVRIVSQKPAINRFVAGRKLYARTEISVNLTVKKELTVQGQETTVKMYFEPTDTIDIVYQKVQKAVEEAKQEGDSNKTDRMARLLNYVPGFILSFVVKVFEFLDYFGLLPRKLIDISPFHGSIFISDLGSIGLPPVYHHLYDFGNISAFLAFGATPRNPLRSDTPKQIQFTLTLDDRICDGHYYSGVFKLLHKILKNPEMLDTPPETVVEDIR
jgi:hypothetical protein